MIYYLLNTTTNELVKDKYNNLLQGNKEKITRLEQILSDHNKNDSYEMMNRDLAIGLKYLNLTSEL